MTSDERKDHGSILNDDERKDHVSIHIDDKLSKLPSTPPKRYIFKVHHQLRQVNEQAYEPQILAIGPYHRDKKSIKDMEEHKLRYLQQLLKRRNESSVERYVVTLKGLEESARNCYAESVSLTVDEFVEMLLLDGCFIIELFYKFKMGELRDSYDPIFNKNWVLHCLTRDLLLFENQLPFSVLSKLFDMTKDIHPQCNLTDIALPIFGIIFPPLWHVCNLKENPSNEIKHLLGLIHNTMISSFEKGGDDRHVETEENSRFINSATELQEAGVKFKKVIKHLRGLIHNTMIPSFEQARGARHVEGNEENSPFINCATELQEAGVKFKKAKGGNFFNIKFKNGVMEIPPLMIGDPTESIFRNLIAYEQYDQASHLGYITDYVTFMDCLIDSSKDVTLLRRQGIIENWQGEDEVVSTMFNKLRDNVISKEKFFYAEICDNVNKYSNKRWNVRIAKLRRNYFHSPWALVSFLAAVLLLVLTSVQTIFSVLSYFQQKLS